MVAAAVVDTAFVVELETACLADQEDLVKVLLLLVAAKSYCADSVAATAVAVGVLEVAVAAFVTLEAEAIAPVQIKPKKPP